MSQQVEGPTKSGTADGAVRIYDRVKVSGADADTGELTFAVAGLAERGVGVAQNVAADGAALTVRLWSAQGTHKVRASEALAVGADVYTESDGEVQDTAQATAYKIGTALEAATGDGHIIEVMVNPLGEVAAS